MANKKKLEAREGALRRKQTERTIQIIGIIIIVLIAVGVIWLTLPKNNPTAAESPQTANDRYSAYPAMTIDVNKKYFATVKMAKGGEFVIQLFPDKAPKTVNNFVFLARDKFYDGTVFHRVIPDFMIQGGDPTGTGRGGPGFKFEDERNPQKHQVGSLSMANAGPNTNGSQFFITHIATNWLDGKHTVFGKVVKGQEVVDAIQQGDELIGVTISEG